MVAVSTKEFEQGLPPITTPEQAAQLLGVAMTADAAVVRSALRAAAGRTHPDAGGSAAEFQRVQLAAELLLWQHKQAQAAPKPLVRVLPGRVVWTGDGVRAWPVAVALAQAGVIVGAAIALGTAGIVSTAAVLATLVLLRGLYRAAGRPPTSAAWWRRQFEHYRRTKSADDWDTGPIPQMTEERMRQYERTGR